MKYFGVSVPRNIGRPQLWMRPFERYHDELLIIYPNGDFHVFLSDSEKWHKVKTSMANGNCITSSVKLNIKISRLGYNKKAKFLGYL